MPFCLYLPLNPIVILSFKAQNLRNTRREQEEEEEEEDKNMLIIEVYKNLKI